MISVSQFTRSIVIGITASCLLPVSASAKDFRVGNVKTRLPTEFCGVLASNGKEEQGELFLITTIDRISIDYRGQTKTIKTTGDCVF